MDVTPPTEEEFQALASTLAYRYPEKACVTVRNDGDVPLRLPLVLGNPTGACALPAGVRALPAWTNAVAVAMKMRADSPQVSEQFVDDCILWPDRKTWSGWVERWPGLPTSVLIPARQKIGASLDGLDEPAFDAEPPAPVAAALAAHPRAVWRRFTVRGQTADLALEPPASTPWRLFLEAMRKRDADAWVLARDLATRSVRGFDGGAGGPASFAEALERWPGVAVVVVSAVGQLAGVSSEADLGNW